MKVEKGVEELEIDCGQRHLLEPERKSRLRNEIDVTPNFYLPISTIHEPRKPVPHSSCPGDRIAYDQINYAIFG